MAAPASTPLSMAFYSKQNIAQIERGISQAIMSETGQRVGPQNPNDLFVLMQTVYAKSFQDPYSDIQRQIGNMNSDCVKEAVQIMKPRIAQFLIYNKNIGKLPPPPEWPGNTSTYGKKLPISKIGF
jgi:hypothetical protein